MPASVVATAVEMGVAPLWVVMNNSAFGTIAGLERKHYGSGYGCEFEAGGQPYSPDFAANGYNGASHGCVNVRDYGSIASLFDQVGIGDKVVVYWS